LICTKVYICKLPDGYNLNDKYFQGSSNVDKFKGELKRYETLNEYDRTDDFIETVDSSIYQVLENEGMSEDDVKKFVGFTTHKVSVSWQVSVDEDLDNTRLPPLENPGNDLKAKMKARRATSVRVKGSMTPPHR
jgi:hypothetical protein